MLRSQLITLHRNLLLSLSTYFPLIGIYLTASYAPHSLAQTLEAYLQQVEKNNLTYQSAQQQKEAAALGAREADLMTSPNVFANAQHAYEGKQQINPPAKMDHVEMQNYSLGIMQQFEFGAQGKLYYAIDRTGYVGSDFAPANLRDSAYDARPVIELSVPLWQNLGGRTTKATAELARSQSETQLYGAQAQSAALLTQAEATYWRLAVAKEVVAIQQKALKQSESILNYVTNRAQKNLGDRADILQAKALTAGRQYELKRAKNEELAALHAFNVLRKASYVEKVDSLDKVDFAKLKNMTIPSARPGERADVRAAKAQANLAKANATIQEDKYRPKLELFGNYAMNGQDRDYGKAVNDSFDSNRPTSAVGLRFSMSLNGGATSAVKRSAALASHAAAMQSEQQAYQQEADWNDLVRRVGEAKENLQLAEAIEDAQEAKLTSERQRLRSGRTTTYQVLMFEQEYSQAELGQVRAAAEILTLMPQLKLYDIENESSEEK